ncbi:Geranylgeranyl pyrophosphate synthase [Komagataella phaffii CBS 7435]|uniref:Geranylgeranyl diphosphate synthase, increases the intracellular pool of geranylgeranyl diphosphate n=2 Tax=Komagataella phaffii TaxID=460519 RepID=C4R682_KOMPG|nr:Geranylgeranyl diphosphate synthase, increases the intracellular pool of geranylgeranyl diphosphate [Komagataella phaffii GS115]AOA63301.1 GQ67_04137T0 [Komagataella phaffii]CAH2449093.1 Geranylgeranyl pyrophosphate synthase [Komagataella phaffii CBS 7435]AOA69341.1 GQ68_04110T0 [Komagataella phaffii GS115]CAY71068.1 Geranylgeranyl diphosphate synthase, increases the intracellular pool of geranylgeranyl diphosphate [Komagataella phaffii GS115]CCA39135.1 Geranylgeranyl pyrophosphate synthase
MSKQWSHDPKWSDEMEKLITEPYKYIKKVPGKHFRRILIDLFNEFLEVDHQSVESIEQVIDILHNSSLMVDDVEDSATLRRGIPATHNVFGIPQTINTANYMYFVAIQKAGTLGNHARVNDVLIEEMMNLHRGQGLDLYWRDNFVCPSEEQYLDMVMNKTGGLFRLTVRLMELVQNPNDGVERKASSLVHFANLLGIVYQIRDDYLNLKSDQYNQNKGFCEDITEGKFSFPIIHSIQNSDDTGLLSILKLRTNDEKLKRFALTYMEQTGSFQYAKEKLSALAKEGEKMLGKISAEFNHIDTSHLNEFLIKLTRIGGDDDKPQYLLQTEETTIPEAK